MIVGLAELALSGCTTVFDHSYIFKSGNTVDCIIDAAKKFGSRFHCSRRSMSLGESKGGLPPDDCVIDQDGKCVTVDLGKIVEEHIKFSIKLANAAI